MNIDLTPDQKELAAAAREFLRADCPPSRVRSVWDADRGVDRSAWARLAEVGFLGVVVPECFGGLGQSDVELALLLEEAGRVALPDPLLETAVAALTIADMGNDRQKERWLPAIAAGELVATVQPPGVPFAVVDGSFDLVVVAIKDSLHAVPVSDCDMEPHEAYDRARRLATVRAQAAADTMLPGSTGRADWLAVRASVAAAATLVGIGAHLVETTVDYVRQREQFGRPVGSFQAVKHQLSNAYLAIEFARPATWVAAHLVASGSDEAPTAAAVAKSCASEAEKTANDSALQCHGGIGFTWEHDLHLWLKRGKALEQAYGTAREHRDRIAQTIFGPSAA
ncbi:hypothetical protein CRM90_26165 [Mycobacterium sp. ENV421]|uniref:acyl-CoA dehydrogenase family protein n=1 Tax=Mycobacterium sp. ENV421 TaxID=1213407 RepID=UPI000C9BEE0C|nr:acyl-CoA dehydrogenase family protein [Mycobacterium sp. ENV421]PND54785.1 hypothetical protein CRM90_26165 [Mycobacterium sp. ENV421]